MRSTFFDLVSRGILAVCVTAMLWVAQCGCRRDPTEDEVREAAKLLIVESIVTNMDRAEDERVAQLKATNDTLEAALVVLNSTPEGVTESDWQAATSKLLATEGEMRKSLGRDESVKWLGAELIGRTPQDVVAKWAKP